MEPFYETFSREALTALGAWHTATSRERRHWRLHLWAELVCAEQEQPAPVMQAALERLAEALPVDSSDLIEDWLVYATECIRFDENRTGLQELDALIVLRVLASAWAPCPWPKAVRDAIAGLPAS